MLNLGGQGMGSYGTGMTGGLTTPGGGPNLQQLLALIQSRGGAGVPPGVGGTPPAMPPTPLAPNNPLTPMANMITPQAIAAMRGGGGMPSGGNVAAPPPPAQMPQGGANNMTQMLQLMQAMNAAKGGQSGVAPQPSGNLPADNPNLIFNPNNPVGTQNLNPATANTGSSWLNSLLGMFGGSGAPSPA